MIWQIKLLLYNIETLEVLVKSFKSNYFVIILDMMAWSILDKVSFDYGFFTLQFGYDDLPEQVGVDRVGRSSLDGDGRRFGSEPVSGDLVLS